MDTASIVGTGPSLLSLRPEHFPSGPVFVLNDALHVIRELRLTQPIYSMQKDGCIIPPREPETVVLEVQHSRNCYPDYPRRLVVDAVEELGIPWWCMSVTMTVAVAYAMGYRNAVMLAHDGKWGDSRRVVNGQIVNTPLVYDEYAEDASKYAERIGFQLEWLRHAGSAEPGLGHRRLRGRGKGTER